MLHYIDSQNINFSKLSQILESPSKLVLSEEAVKKIKRCREYLDKRLESGEELIYGINTGFGSLYNRVISREDLGKLQKNLVMSHACGIGEEVPQRIVKLMLFLKAQSLSYGNSGVQLITVQRLLDLYNEEIYPVVYQYGSLGASGDLAPLAHMSLPLIGLGEVYYRGKKYPSAEILKKFNWDPIDLKSKEGLALLNGTQFMSAYGVELCLRVFKLSQLSDIIASLSLEAFDGRIEPFHELIQKIRPYEGQIKTAARVRWLLNDSELINRPKKHVQDPYSFRCIPQVHGASKDSIKYVAYVFQREINSVTDNPTIFPEEDLIISAGNFHGQPLALALDNLAIAMSELGNISERRTYQLVGGHRNLPPFLAANPGLNSGFMIPQYTAASMVSHNKQLSTPSSVDSIESSQGQEDHVSMGANAAVKAYKVMENLERILAIELYNAAQAMDFRRPARTSSFLEDILLQYRKRVDFIEDDKVMYTDINKTVDFLREIVLQLPEEENDTDIQG
ncbi:MAG: histidine ammonia-lyase [Bacteroidales bacterium]|nr:histidine ammonia-lyase [Bacteroidales bacterium]MCB8999258.1 histidine ammonia-lyase [Bacteroidales bacterium]MCB9013074.1 histidine ammonia-lyase [Bacteroidales bacterium]